jgi:hypothetical protein
MTQLKRQFLNPGNSPQIIATAIVGIISSYAGAEAVALPIAIAGSIGMLGWQTAQANKFKQIVAARFDAIENQLDQLLDLDFMSSPEFLELVLRATEAAFRTASEQKHKALANALVASTVRPSSSFSGKMAMIRIIDQMSEEDLVVLKTLFEIEDAQTGDDNTETRVALKKIQEKLGWIEEEVIVACESLAQLGLTKDRTSSASANCWNTTVLSKRLLQFIIRTADN